MKKGAQVFDNNRSSRVISAGNAALMGSSLFLGMSVATHGQDSDQRIVLEEVTVTANKREQSLLDVPASLSAFTAERLEASGIETVLDLSNFTPGLSVEPSRAGGGSLYIRGIGSNLLGAGVDPSIAIYRDGAYIARHVVAFQDFIDVDRVEVLRGPQGTLYGRNATGGAINVVSKLPRDRLEMSARLDAGNYDKRGVALAVGGPLVDDMLLGRISYSNQKRESYWENVFLGETLDGEDSQSVNATLLFRPADNFEAILRYNDYENDAVGNVAFKNVLRGPSTIPALPEPDDEFEVNNDYLPDNNTADTNAIGLELTWDVGDVTLKSLTTLRDIDASSTFDTDGTNLPIGYSISEESSDMLSQEFQISMPLGDSVNMLAGLYYYDEEVDSRLDFQYPNGGPACAYFGQPADCSARTTFVSTNQTEAYAAFADATWAVSERLRLTAGIRYSDEKKEFESQGGFDNYLLDISPTLGLPPGTFVLDASTTGAVQDKDEWSDVTGRFVVEYDFGDDLMVYTSVSEGFKSGGFNSSDAGIIDLSGVGGAPASGSQGSFDPENIISYETGVKGSMFDGRTQGSLALFYYDYEDLQVRFVDSVNGTLPIRNAGAAEVFGIEFEGTANATEKLRVDWAVTYLDSEYKDFESAQDLVTGLPVDLSGESLIRTPTLKASLGVEYFISLGDVGSLTARGEYLYQDEQKFGQSINPFLEGGDYAYFNARLTWADVEGRWYVAAWGQNLNDDIYETTISYNNLNGGAVIYGTPRTYGVTLGYNY